MVGSMSGLRISGRTWPPVVVLFAFICLPLVLIATIGSAQVIVGATGAAAAPISTYDAISPFAQAADDNFPSVVHTERETLTAVRQVRGAEIPPTTVSGFGVATKSGPSAYRGVGRNHPGYDDALKGRVNPRNPNGTATPAQHNAGNTTDSPYTSWTRDPDTARRFAGPDGVVLRVPRGEGSPYKFDWSPDVYYEQEILIRGPVCGAKIC